MAIAFAEGIDQYYWYNFRSREEDPTYSEHHFGLAHSNRTPKPALGAYSNFILARPPGSVQSPGPWHDEKREFFFPQWTRPDGTKAGIVWKTGATERRALRFTTTACPEVSPSAAYRGISRKAPFLFPVISTALLWSASLRSFTEI